MSKFVKQFRRSFKVGDLLMDGQFTWHVDYIGYELVVMRILKPHFPSDERVFYGPEYRWRKVKP